MVSFFLGIIFWFWPQVTDQWVVLASARVERRMDSFLKQEIDVVIFNESIISFAGKDIVLEGYMIPLEATVDQHYFVFSRFPYQSCFFCGAAGPETVAEVYINEPMPATEKRIQVSGKLKLNADDPLHLFYLITEAEVKILN